MRMDELAEITNKIFVPDTLEAEKILRNILFDKNFQRIWHKLWWWWLWWWWWWWWWWYWWLWSHNEKGQKHVGVKIVDQTKHKFTTKCTFFSKDSIVYHWEHKKRFYVHWWWIVPGNTICWTFWLHYIVESLININTKTICHCTLLHWRQLLCSVILY